METQQYIIEDYELPVFGGHVLITIEAYGTFKVAGQSEGYSAGGYTRFYDDYELADIEVQSAQVDGALDFNKLPKEVQKEIRDGLQEARE